MVEDENMESIQFQQENFTMSQATCQSEFDLKVDCFCKFCHRNFEYVSQLKEHLVQAHRRDYLEMCKQCGKVFFSASGFQDHKNMIHGHGQFVGVSCPICGKVLPRESRLKTHEKSYRRTTLYLSNLQEIIQTQISFERSFLQTGSVLMFPPDC